MIKQIADDQEQGLLTRVGHLGGDRGGQVGLADAIVAAQDDPVDGRLGVPRGVA